MHRFLMLFLSLGQKQFVDFHVCLFAEVHELLFFFRPLSVYVCLLSVPPWALVGLRTHSSVSHTPVSTSTLPDDNKNHCHYRKKSTIMTDPGGLDQGWRDRALHSTVVGSGGRVRRRGEREDRNGEEVVQGSM